MRNPPWSRDELILTLDFYKRHSPKFPGKHSEEIQALSETLNKLSRITETTGDERFRNASGVYMKLMNFRRFDPNNKGSGLQRGNKDEEVVWNLFSGKESALRDAAEAIRRFASSGETGIATIQMGDEEEDFAEANEGRLLTKVHLQRERSAKIVEKKKNQFLSQHGRLFCEACGFDFQRVYGERGLGFIECHHIRPVSELKPGDRTKLSDLALVCSNCHRMIHRKRPWLELLDLRKKILRS